MNSGKKHKTNRHFSHVFYGPWFFSPPSGSSLKKKSSEKWDDWILSKRNLRGIECSIPIGSMYGIFAYNYGRNQPNIKCMANIPWVDPLGYFKEVNPNTSAPAKIVWETSSNVCGFMDDPNRVQTPKKWHPQISIHLAYDF